VPGQNTQEQLPEAIYALPDHQVVAALLPEATSRHLSTSEAAGRIRDNRGLLPVAIDPEGEGRIFWADLGAHPLKEWQFVYTVKALAEQNAIGECFTSGMDLLDLPELFEDSVVPSALIFHISRCGSTLVAKALSRPEGHMMISQAGPLQHGFWAHATDDWRRPLRSSPQLLTRLRTLVLALCRRRRGDERRAFMKFISWNVLYIDLIAAAVPEAACLFLYRDPIEVVASVRRQTTAVLQVRGQRQGAFLSGASKEATATMSEEAYLASCYARYLETALSTRADVAYINYCDLDPEAFARVASEGLDLDLSPAEHAAMREQFAYHSKDDDSKRQFLSDTLEKRAGVSSGDHKVIADRCADAVDRLNRSPRNLFARGRPSYARHEEETVARSCP